MLSLAVGIGFNTALFSIVDALLFRPLPIADPARIVDVYTRGSDGDTYATNSYPDYLDFKAGNTVFTDMLGYSPSIGALKAGDRSRMALGEVVTGNYFQVLGVPAAIGPHAAAGGRPAGRAAGRRDLPCHVAARLRPRSRGARAHAADPRTAVHHRRRHARSVHRAGADAAARDVDADCLGRGRRARRHPGRGAVANRDDAARSARPAMAVREGAPEGRRNRGARRGEPAGAHGAAGQRRIRRRTSSARSPRRPTFAFTPRPTGCSARWRPV